MSEPIIIETPAPPTRERLVLVPPGCPLPILARDATAADLERAGYVPLSAFVGPLDLLSPPTLAGALEAIEGIRQDADRWEHVTSYLEERDEAVERAVADMQDAEKRVEKAELERNGLLARINDAEEAARTLRAELARLAAPGEGACWACREDLGVDHERARQQPEKDRATDEELVDLYRKVYETHGGLTIDVSHGDCRRAAVRAVAARVRQGRCLVAQAVGRGVDVHVTEFVPTQWRVVVTDREATSKTAPCSAADVPATLARLLGEVSR